MELSESFSHECILLLTSMSITVPLGLLRRPTTTSVTSHFDEIKKSDICSTDTTKSVWNMSDQGSKHDKTKKTFVLKSCIQSFGTSKFSSTRLNVYDAFLEHDEGITSTDNCDTITNITLRVTSSTDRIMVYSNFDIRNKNNDNHIVLTFADYQDLINLLIGNSCGKLSITLERNVNIFMQMFYSDKIINIFENVVPKKFAEFFNRVLGESVGFEIDEDSVECVERIRTEKKYDTSFHEQNICNYIDFKHFRTRTMVWRIFFAGIEIDVRICSNIAKLNSTKSRYDQDKNQQTIKSEQSKCIRYKVVNDDIIKEDFITSKK